jgi:hypothetical protein
MKKVIKKVNCMNCDKELKLTHSKPKAQWWRKGLIWGFIFTVGIISLGCDNENEIIDLDEYYVKYEVSSSTIYIGGKLDVTISTENNKNKNFTINQRTQSETVIGPVKKGFNATLKVKSKSTDYNHLRLYTNIYVSKNGSPFALKESDGSDTPRDFVQIDYTINY